MAHPGRIGPKNGEKIAKNIIFENQPNFDFFKKCDISMPIRPEILAQIVDTRCFLETFRLTCCIQNIAEHILCPNLILGRIQNVPEMSKSTIFGNFHHSEKLNLRNSAHFNSAQIRLKTLEIYSPIHFGHLIPYGDFNFLNRFGPKYSHLKIDIFPENRKIAIFDCFGRKIA